MDGPIEIPEESWLRGGTPDELRIVPWGVQSIDIECDDDVSSCFAKPSLQRGNVQAVKVTAPGLVPGCVHPLLCGCSTTVAPTD